MASSKPIFGIKTVNSDVIKPDELSRKNFDDWYCDEHIPDMVDKSGSKPHIDMRISSMGTVPSAGKMSPNMTTLSNQLPFFLSTTTWFIKELTRISWKA
jgi:hypothetical protein